MSSVEIQELDTPLSSQLYWLWRNLSQGTLRWVRRNRVRFVIVGCVLVIGLLLFRAALQPLVLAIRINIVPTAAAIALIGGSLWFWHKGHRLAGGILFFLALGGIVAFIASKGVPRDYVSMYWHYRTIAKSDIDRLPTTDHERIQPLNSIRVLASEAMTEVQNASEPGIVRDGDQYFWTMAVEPSYLVSRITGNVSEILKVSASAPSPNFSQENRADVAFLTGERLVFSRNAKVAAINRLGPWRYFNYEPADVRYLRDSEGHWKQVITLTRWKGLLFPRPVFGGVLVVDQKKGGALPWLSNALLGSGKWIRPQELENHEFLKGQSVVPARVSRFTAESFRFQKGFFAPLPGYHIGDIRIPDLPGDYNDQPFTAYFDFGDHAKLYHYFGLEPFQPDKQGLNTSVFVPADGLGATKVFHHHERGDALTGVSAIVAKVMESRKNYDWERNTAAEQRPFIRDIGGQRRFFWLTTVVTFKDDGPEAGSRFIAGSTPDVTLTDALYKAVVWVDARKPAGWELQLEQELSGVWEAD